MIQCSLRVWEQQIQDINECGAGLRCQSDKYGQHPGEEERGRGGGLAEGRGRRRGGGRVSRGQGKEMGRGWIEKCEGVGGAGWKYMGKKGMKRWRGKKQRVKFITNY
jgi:hypothetical protein